MMSKSVRDEAVLLLSALASKGVQSDTIAGSFFEYAEHLELSDDALAVARAAYDAIPSMQHVNQFETGLTPFTRECLEAQCLLASGWERGDDIEMIEQPRFVQSTREDQITQLDDGAN